MHNSWNDFYERVLVVSIRCSHLLRQAHLWRLWQSGKRVHTCGGNNILKKGERTCVVHGSLTEESALAFGHASVCKENISPHSLSFVYLLNILLM